MSFMKYIPGVETAKEIAAKPFSWLKQKGSEIFHGATDKVIGGVQDATRMALSGLLKGIMSIPVIAMKTPKSGHD